MDFHPRNESAQRLPDPAVLPAGERVYAIGDIHGCLTELEHLHQAIVKDLAAHPVRWATLVHLGDYIDRGPSSAAVLTRLMAPPAHLAGMQIINLMGNHEAMLLDALDGDEEVAEAWLANGGDLALESWGATGKHWRLAITTPCGALVWRTSFSIDTRRSADGKPGRIIHISGIQFRPLRKGFSGGQGFSVYR